MVPLIGAAAIAALIAGKNAFCAVAIREVGRPNASVMPFSQAAVPSWPTGAEPTRATRRLKLAHGRSIERMDRSDSTTIGGGIEFPAFPRRHGTELEAVIGFDLNGAAQMVAAPPRTAFKRSVWQVRRETRADAGVVPRQVLPMLDAPFYSRSAVQTTINGEQVTGVHEALDLDRFAKGWLKPILAVRVPRRAGWTFDKEA